MPRFAGVRCTRHRISALARIAEGPADFSDYPLAAHARSAGCSAGLDAGPKGDEDSDASLVEANACWSATLQLRSDCQSKKGRKVAQRLPPPSFPRRRESIVMLPRTPALTIGRRRRRAAPAYNAATQQRIVHGLPKPLQALRDHIFSGVIWPDFTRLPSAEAPVLELKTLAVGDTLVLDGHRIEVLSAAHTVPAVGYAVYGGAAGWWVYTGDTGPNPALWQRLADMKVAHLVIETAFSDEERQLARISRHLCPAALDHELTQLRGSVDVHITHIKPGEMDAVMRDRAVGNNAPDSCVGGGAARRAQLATRRPRSSCVSTSAAGAPQGKGYTHSLSEAAHLTVCVNCYLLRPHGSTNL
jgi:hypothetical protein